MKNISNLAYFRCETNENAGCFPELAIMANVMLPMASDRELTTLDIQTIKKAILDAADKILIDNTKKEVK